MKPHILGLTGGIACGKSTVARKLAALGAVHIDADFISHSLTAPGGKALPAIAQAFGAEVFSPDGTLNRKALGRQIFSQEEKRRTLEGILHPMVRQEMLLACELAAQENKPVCLFDVPLLLETGMDALCDTVWVVTLPKEQQLHRLMQRDRLSREEALARIAAQLSSEERIARADLVFSTDKPEADTLQEVEQRYQELLRQLKRR